MAKERIYSDDIANIICERIADGESLRSICESDEMPAKSTVFDWLADDRYEAFRTKYARAREAQADALVDEMIDIADDGSNDWMEKRNADGENIGWMENGDPAPTGTCCPKPLRRVRQSGMQSIHTRASAALMRLSRAKSSRTGTTMRCSFGSRPDRRFRWWAPTTSIALSVRLLSGSRFRNGRWLIRVPGRSCRLSLKKMAAGLHSSPRHAATIMQRACWTLQSSMHTTRSAIHAAGLRRFSGQTRQEPSAPKG